jgi:putative adhesin
VKESNFLSQTDYSWGLSLQKANFEKNLEAKTLMRSFMSSRVINSALILVICMLCGLIASGQTKVDVREKIKEKSSGFCSENSWSSDDKQSFRDLREMTIPAGGTLDVDAGRNGGINVKGENRSDISVRACVQAWGSTLDAAKAAVASVRINTTGGVRADGPDESNYSVSFQVLVPRSTDVTLKAHNGGISIVSVNGRIEFETVNGGVNLGDLSGEVRGRTTNGGLNVALMGKGWEGNGMDVQTSNGGVRLLVPENYAANFEAGTVNGGFSSDIPALNVTTENVAGGWRNRSKQIKTAINGGGAPIRVATTNGGITISSTNESVRY